MRGLAHFGRWAAGEGVGTDFLRNEKSSKVGACRVNSCQRVLEEYGISQGTVWPRAGDGFGFREGGPRAVRHPALFCILRSETTLPLQALPIDHQGIPTHTFISNPYLILIITLADLLLMWHLHQDIWLASHTLGMAKTHSRFLPPNPFLT